jgi:hypothetical protein
MGKAIYELSNEIIIALDKKLLVGRIFWFIAKSFDCINHVNHGIFLPKLNCYRITDKANHFD